jgi:hypothetical protein
VSPTVASKLWLPLLLACACSSGSNDADTRSDAAAPGAGGALGSGGSSAGGSSGSQTGGAGGSAGQSPTVACVTDAGQLPLEAKACETSADCESLATYSCCGPGVIIGLAKSAPEYRRCFGSSYPQNCPPLGCASFPSTEDGSALEGSSVLARCLAVDGGTKACMTSACKDKAPCDAGDTCLNACGFSCACESGQLVCDKPQVGQNCPENGSLCAYVDDPTAPTLSGETCVCRQGLWDCVSY